MAKKPPYEELEKKIQALERNEFQLIRTEEALRESAKKYRCVMDASLAGNFVVKGFKFPMSTIVCVSFLGKDRVKNSGCMVTFAFFSLFN